jgi:hypothetical protein
LQQPEEFMDKVPIDVMKPITGRKSRRAPDLAHSWINRAGAGPPIRLEQFQSLIAQLRIRLPNLRA